MQFNDTSTYDGLVQHYEKWTRQPRGTVSSDNDLLKEFASEVNSNAFPKLIPLLLAFNDQIRWDDLNYTDAPVGFVNLVSGQNDYKVSVDDNSADILNFVNVRILASSSATVYTQLERILADDWRVPDILNPQSGITGVPSGFLELGNVIRLDIAPSYNATNGLELTFGRQNSFFAYTDTSKEAGIPLPFHILLALYPALSWNSINRTEDTNLLTLLREEIKIRENDCRNFIALRNPTKATMTMKKIKYT